MSAPERSFEFGPAGAGAMPIAITLWVKEEAGRLTGEIAVDVVPPPAACRVESAGRVQEVPLSRLELNTGEISYASVELPAAASYRVEVMDAQGASIPGLAFVAEMATGVASATPVPVAINAAAQAAPQRVRQGLRAVQRDEPPAPRALEPAPAGPPAPVAHEAPRDLLPDAAGPVPFDPPRRRVSVGAGSEWPSKVGELGTGLGPETVTGKQVVTLVNVRRGAASTELDVLLQDEGVIASLAIARDGIEIAREVPHRLTALAPALVTITLEDTRGQLALIACNAYGEAFPNVIAELDLERAQFRPFAPARAVWGRAMRLTGPLDLPASLCASCRAPVHLGRDVAWADLRARDRERLRQRFPLTASARGLCPACHEELILSGQLRHAILRWFTGERLQDGAIRLAFGYLAALAIATAPGALVGRFLETGFQGGVDRSVAFALAALLFATVGALLPWPGWVRATVAGWRGAVPRGRAPGALAVLVPLTVGALVWLGASSAARLPRGFAPSPWTAHIAFAALAGFAVASAALFSLERLVERRSRERLRPHETAMQRGKASVLAPRLFAVTTRGQYEETMERTLIEGLGALEFQLHARRPRHHEFLPVRSVGAFSPRGARMRFEDTGKHVLGYAARCGYPVSSADIGPDQLIHPDEIEVKLPFALVIPVWAQGRVAEVYCVTRLRQGADLADALRLAELLALAAGQCLHRLTAESMAVCAPAP